MRNKLAIAFFALVFVMLSLNAVSAERFGQSKGQRGQGIHMTEEAKQLRDQMREQRRLENQKAINADDFECPFMMSNKTNSCLMGLNQNNSLRRMGFAEAVAGSGWITDGSEGFLIGTVWVNQNFASYVDSTNKTETSTKTIGRLSVRGVGAYVLLLNEKDSSNESLVFTVSLPEGKKNEDSPDSVGTLNLQLSSSTPNLKAYNGELVLTSGDLIGDWNVNLATDSNTLKGNAFEGKKVGFFKRLAFWRKG